MEKECPNHEEIGHFANLTPHPIPKPLGVLSQLGVIKGTF